LTGRLPFEAETSMETLAKVLAGRMTRLHARRPELPARLVEVIERCLSLDPNARPADAAELARALSGFGSGACDGLVARIERTLRPARPSERPFLLALPKTVSLPVPMVTRRRRGRRAPLAIGAAVVVALLGASAVHALGARPARPSNGIVVGATAEVSDATPRPPPR
jgi:hypothetical protein